MMTMPSLLGFEGINPLTVYFCYRPGGQIFLAVLEVHNTFGESHVYCLEIDKGEDKLSARGIDHQWTIPGRSTFLPSTTDAASTPSPLTIPPTLRLVLLSGNVCTPAT
ncbi:hypothetical protein B0H14DRAFT_745565 [Mycena olivaceomarginata]|nr:hypothetical protein B0H14DRAFT_745565 [Mycena olivaceomarginata]